MKKVPVTVDPGDYPQALRWLFDGAAVYDSSCHSAATVLYVDSGYYLKTDEPGTLSEEAARSRWFHDLGLGPEVVSYLSADRDYLLTREAAGEDMTHFLSDPRKLCRELARALRFLHSRPVDGAPVSARLRRYLESAETGKGFYDASVGMKRFHIPSREAALDIMRTHLHRLKADTLIHGDACLPNVMVKDGAFSGFLDFALAGVGDRHIDLYWAVWSLEFNLATDAWTEEFLDCYGRENFDAEMLRVIAAFEIFG